MKYYNIELLQDAAEKLQQLLYDLNIKFEISAAGAYYHFEILLNKNSDEFNKVNNFLTEV
jgi:hypothetical protein